MVDSSGSHHISEAKIHVWLVLVRLWNHIILSGGGWTFCQSSRMTAEQCENENNTCQPSRRPFHFNDWPRQDLTKSFFLPLDSWKLRSHRRELYLIFTNSYVFLSKKKHSRYNRSALSPRISQSIQIFMKFSQLGLRATYFLSAPIV